MSEKEPMLCTCGKIAFVQLIVGNPRPENPTPCRECYLEIVKLRNEQALKGVSQNENREY
jgi:hypothetical protein